MTFLFDFSRLTKSEPTTFCEASKFTHRTDAMNNEMDAILRNDTWEVTNQPKDRKAIWVDFEGEIPEVVTLLCKRRSSLKADGVKLQYGSKSVFKIKYKSNGEIDRYKARLVAKGFNQKEGVDFEELFSLVVKMGICLNQWKYVLDLLFEYGMLVGKPTKTPLQSKLSITNEATVDDPLLDNITDYQKLTRKLIYLTDTRTDISYDVHCLSQFMHFPLKSHLKTAFKILRYLKGSPGLRIHVTKSLGKGDLADPKGMSYGSSSGSLYQVNLLETLHKGRHQYGISEALHPELLRTGDRIVDFPEDERVFPTAVDWRTNASKDGMPANGTYSVEDVRALDTHRTPIQKQPKMLLCMVRISRRYYLGDEVYPTFHYDDDR
nr:ribonuclease H-like domain-containing protein [Tanacetum cinerariifolium]